jgi:hypothetical protein
MQALFQLSYSPTRSRMLQQPADFARPQNTQSIERRHEGFASRPADATREAHSGIEKGPGISAEPLLVPLNTWFAAPSARPLVRCGQ